MCLEILCLWIQFLNCDKYWNKEFEITIIAAYLCESPNHKDMIEFKFLRFAAIVVMSASLSGSVSIQAQVLEHTVEPARNLEKSFALKMQGKEIINGAGNISAEEIENRLIKLQSNSAYSGMSQLNVVIDYNEDHGERPHGVALAFESSVDQPQFTDYKYGCFDGEKYIFSLPDGTYNMYFKCSSPKGLIVIARENITVRGDSEINISTEEAVNHITFTSLKANGSVVKDDLVNPQTGEIDDKGNIENGAWLVALKLCYHGMPLESLNFLAMRYYSENGEERSIADNDASVWVNTNGIMSFGRIDLFGSKEGIHYVSHYSGDSNARDIVNNVNDYVSVKEEYLPLPKTELGADEYEVKGCVGFDYLMTDNGFVRSWQRMAILSKIEMDVQNNILNICTPIDEPENPMNIMPCFYTYPRSLTFSGFEGKPLRVNPDKSISRLGYVQATDIIFAMSDESGNVIDCPDYRFTFDEEPELKYGESCPITIFSFMNNGKGHPEFNYDFAGRLNEWREADKHVADLRMSLDGKVILESESNFVKTAEKMSELFFSWYDSPAKVGKYEIDIVNDNYFTTTGMQGLNKTHIEFDSRRDDYTAPVLRGLIFWNKNGSVVQSFETIDNAAKGQLELAVADGSRDDLGYYHYDGNTSEVIVEYAPYGTDNYKPIEVREKKEWVNVPGFGNHFVGNLPMISDKGEGGWYDVRIKLTDKSGNMQSQLIRPAFQIKEMSSVSNLDIDRFNEEDVVVYSLQGVRLDKPVVGQPCIVVTADGGICKVIRH